MEYAEVINSALYGISNSSGGGNNDGAGAGSSGNSTSNAQSMRQKIARQREPLRARFHVSEIKNKNIRYVCKECSESSDQYVRSEAVCWKIARLIKHAKTVHGYNPSWKKDIELATRNEAAYTTALKQESNQRMRYQEQQQQPQPSSQSTSATSSSAVIESSPEPATKRRKKAGAQWSGAAKAGNKEEHIHSLIEKSIKTFGLSHKWNENNDVRQLFDALVVYGRDTGASQFPSDKHPE